jgi:RimJ/RimL family protein N-acetyltransferase
MTRLDDRALTFRPLTPDDVRLLHSWVQRPHVAQWWAEPRTLEDIERDYLPVVAGASSTHAYIVLLDDAPVGFIQSYVVEADPAARGIDQFIADGELVGRGLGTAVVRAFVDRLFADPAVTKVLTDPSPSNERAIRCYARAGFVDQGVVDTPDGAARLMVRVRG